MAMKAISGCSCAVLRRERNVFSAKGQPQWRRKVKIVGLLSELGISSLPGIDGAGKPILGGEEMGEEVQEVQ